MAEQEMNENDLPPEMKFMVRAFKGHFNSLRQQLGGLEDRIERIELWVGRRNGGNGAQNQGRGNGEHEGEEEGVEVVEEANGEGRNRNGENRGARRDGNGSDDEVKNIKMAIPPFKGKNDPDAYFEWERKVEKIFEFNNYSERKKIKLAAFEFSEYASLWWDKLVLTRRRNGDLPIETWREMKTAMRRRFVPTWYHRELHNQLSELVQGRMSVAEYDQETEMLLTKLGIQENPETTISRFINGLNWEIQVEIEMCDFFDYEEMVLKATQIEKKLKKQKKRAQTSTTSWKSKDKKDFRSDYKHKIDYSKTKTDYSKTKEGEDSKGKGKMEETSTRPSGIRCFKCQGRGHIGRNCPNKHSMVTRKDGIIETDSEEAESDEEPKQEESDHEDRMNMF